MRSGYDKAAGEAGDGGRASKGIVPPQRIGWSSGWVAAARRTGSGSGMAGRLTMPAWPGNELARSLLRPARGTGHRDGSRAGPPARPAGCERVAFMRRGWMFRPIACLNAPRKRRLAGQERNGALVDRLVRTGKLQLCFTNLATPAGDRWLLVASSASVRSGPECADRGVRSTMGRPCRNVPTGARECRSDQTRSRPFGLESRSQGLRRWSANRTRGQ